MKSPTTDRPTDDGSAAAPGSTRAPRRRGAARIVWVILAALLGLALGVAGGWYLAGRSTPSYISSSTFSVVPDGAGRGARSDSVQPAQVAFLTPVVSARSTSSAITAAVTRELGHASRAEISTHLIPDSPLLFQNQARADTPGEAYSTARAVEKSLEADSAVKSVLKDSGARLEVVSAAMPAKDGTSIPKTVIVGGAAAAGALLFGGMALGFSQRRRG